MSREGTCKTKIAPMCWIIYYSKMYYRYEITYGNQRCDVDMISRRSRETISISHWDNYGNRRLSSVHAYNNVPPPVKPHISEIILNRADGLNLIMPCSGVAIIFFRGRRSQYGANTVWGFAFRPFWEHLWCILEANLNHWVSLKKFLFLVA